MRKGNLVPLEYLLQIIFALLVIIFFTKCESTNTTTKSHTPPLSYFPNSSLTIKADSFLLFDRTDSAALYYKKSLETNPDIADSLYNTIRLQSIDTSYNQINPPDQSQPYLKSLSIIQGSADSIGIEFLKGYINNEHSSLTSWDSAAVYNRVAKYYQEKKFILDSSWLYSCKAFHVSSSIPGIYNIDIDIINRLIKLAINKRKLLLSIALANLLNDFSNYQINISSRIIATSKLALGYQLFRIDQNQESYELNNKALEIALLEKDNEIIQLALRSQLYTIITWSRNRPEWADSMFLEFNHKFKEICILTQNQFDYHRVNAFHNYHHGNFQEVILNANKALTHKPYDIPIPEINNLLHMLSQAYYMNDRIDLAIQTYNKIEVKPFSFIKNTKLSSYHFEIYQRTKNSSYLFDAEENISLAFLSVFTEINVIHSEDINEFRESLNDLFNVAFRIYNELFSYYPNKEEYESRLLNIINARRGLVFQKLMTMDNNTLKKNDNSVVLFREINKEKYNSEVFTNSIINSASTWSESQFFNTLNNLSTNIDLDYLKYILNSSHNTIVSFESFDTLNYIVTTSSNNTKTKIIPNTKTFESQTKYISNSQAKNKIDSSYFAQSYKFYNEYLQSSLDSSQNIIFIHNRFTKNINFEAIVSRLNDFTHPDFLIKKHNITYSNSLNEIIYNNYSQSITKNKLAIFCFSDKESLLSIPNSQLTELPHSYLLSKYIQATDENVLLYTGKNCTKENFLKTLKDPEIEHIHLATHGEVGEDNQYDVKLFFRKQDYGLDTLFGFELQNITTTCSSLILSTCHSADGFFHPSFGTHSITSIFKSIGVSKVIAVAGSIEDKDSYSILKNYYHSQSLSETKRQVIQEGSTMKWFQLLEY